MTSLLGRLAGGLRRPRSMVVLVVAGFLLVAGPLLIAIIGGSVYVDRLAERSDRLVRQSVAVVRDSEALRAQLLSMERTARQYQIVGEAELAELYADRHEVLLATLTRLDAYGLPTLAIGDTGELEVLARDVAMAMAADDTASGDLDAAIANFSRMRRLAGDIARSAEMAIDSELARLEEESRTARRFLFWQTTALAPVTILIGGVFAWLILQPIRRLARAIRSLGSVEPPAPIAVGGPPEIRALGIELERLRVRLERSEAEKNRFLRHMSHELKTPLAAIREGTELLADGSVQPGTDAYAEIVDILRSSSMDLQQLIENVLVLSARDLARIAEPIDLEELVEDVLSRHRLALSRADLSIERHVLAASFDGYKPLVQAALSNLVGNAIRFSPRGGTLYVGASRHRGWVMLEVGDEGPGIREEDRPHVFEPFFQGEPGPQAPVRGTGVGLSVVRDCARAHEGSVEIVDGVYPGTHIRMMLRTQGSQSGLFSA